jgi:hypothetical protein
VSACEGGREGSSTLLSRDRLFVIVVRRQDGGVNKFDDMRLQPNVKDWKVRLCRDRLVLPIRKL